MKSMLKISLGIMIISILLTGFAWAVSSDSIQDESFEEYYYFPDYGSSTFDSLKEDSKLIESRGTVPVITEDKEKMEWLDTIWECINNSGKELHPYMKENGGPLIGFGVDYGGYIFVEFDEEIKDVDKYTIDKFYNIINANAKKVEIFDVPVVFTKGEKVYLDSRTSIWNNLIGGIQIVRSTGTPSTLSFAAEDSSGTKGFVISGHAAFNAGGVGASIYQPTTATKVGEVNYLTGHFADAAWVEASNVEDNIYYTDVDDVRDVRSYYDPSLGSKVYKSGIATGLTSGYVNKRYFSVTHPNFGTLYDQFRADYDSAGGDSGAPIFSKYGDQVIIHGVHWGSTDTNTYFSPISGVELDLDVTPLTS
ncbi:S1 family peptidase [Methanococcoides methylutens]|uniref:S1 family peptidase n=1 Tax=Methanococcoides methylutens TaxID=2226 RepID=UPI000693DE65|nr:S1 family peptidase [Methanococcoides methylutens]